MITYTYRKTEHVLWTVGDYTPSGEWVPESDHDSPEEAAARVRWLNGGGVESQIVAQLLEACKLIVAAEKAVTEEGNYQLLVEATEVARATIAAAKGKPDGTLA